MIEMRQDNDMTDRDGLLYAKKKIELWWLIQQGMVYDENQIGQWRNWSYKWFTLKSKLNFHDQSNRMWSNMKSS